MVTYTYDPGTWEAQVEGLWVGGQTGLCSKNLTQCIRSKQIILKFKKIFKKSPVHCFQTHSFGRPQRGGGRWGVGSEMESFVLKFHPRGETQRLV